MSLANDDGFVEEGGLLRKPKLDTRMVLRNPEGHILYSGVGLYGTIESPRYTEIVQVFASCQQAALIAFHNRFRHIKFSQVWVAPAIGFFVHDSHGDVLSTGGERPGENIADRGTEFEGAR
jgi:hypothetical protein